MTTCQISSLTRIKTNSADATTPWFDVAPNHTVMLSGFPPKGSYIANLTRRSLNLRPQASSGRPNLPLPPQIQSDLGKIRPQNLRLARLPAILLLVQNPQLLQPTPPMLPIPSPSRTCLQLNNRNSWENTSNFSRRLSKGGRSYKKLTPTAPPQRPSFL